MIKVSALQICPEFLAKQANMQVLDSLIRTCDAELLVLPELVTTGYFFESKEQLVSVAEPAEGPFCTMLRDLAVSDRKVIVAGFAEAERGRIFNSAATVLPDGSISIYRKTHLFAEEKQIFTPGDTGFQVVEYGGLKLGTMICYDWRFPESVRTLALKGAQLICHPSDLVALPRLWKPVMRTRSFENKVFTITANRTGTETRGQESLTFHGCSQITGTNGWVLAETDENGEGWIAVDIDPVQASKKSFSEYNDIFSDRRPEMYEL